MTLKIGQTRGECWMVHMYQVHVRCKFGDRRSVICRDNRHTSIFSTMTQIAGKVGQSDLFFCCGSRFISRFVRARLQVSVCIGYDLCHPG